MYGKNSQKGQGLIEYMLIIAVVVVAVVAFAVAFKDVANTATDTMQSEATNAISQMQN